MNDVRTDTPESGVWTLRPGDDHWPSCWNEVDHPPQQARGSGRRRALRQPAVAIVGTRAASTRSLAVARRLACDLARAGWSIVSGLALGVDAAAHAGALEANGVTVGVMATGVDRTYPARHGDLRRRIEARGCVVTEAPDGTAPLPFLFPRRNRLVSGLARGVIVVEAPYRSGAMSTAYHGADQGREIFAVPGPVDDPGCRGCHHLLREGAHIAESARDVINVLGRPDGRNADAVDPPADLLPVAGSAARWIWDRLDLTGLRLSELRDRWAGTDAVWHEGLVALEIASLIVRLPGGGIARKVWVP
jgi:DNA processing protein